MRKRLFYINVHPSKAIYLCNRWVGSLGSDQFTRAKCRPPRGMDARSIDKEKPVAASTQFALLAAKCIFASASQHAKQRRRFATIWLCAIV